MDQPQGLILVSTSVTVFRYGWAEPVVCAPQPKPSFSFLFSSRECWASATSPEWYLSRSLPLILTMEMLAVGEQKKLLTWPRPCRALVLPVAGATADTYIFFNKHFLHRNKEQQQKNQSLKEHFSMALDFSFSATPCLPPRVLRQAKLLPPLPFYLYLLKENKFIFCPGLPLPSHSSSFRVILGVDCLLLSAFHLTPLVEGEPYSAAVCLETLAQRRTDLSRTTVPPPVS